MARKRARLEVEVLESRTVPTVSAQLINGSLYLSGSTNGELDITGTGTPYEFTVKDAGHNVGAGLYAITGNLSINLTLEKGDIKFDLMGDTLPGNVTINLGAGYVGTQTPPNYSVDIYDSTGTGAIDGAGLGEINGTVTILKGNGTELFNIGTMQTNPGATLTQYPITIDGGLTVVGSPSNAHASQGNGLTIGDGTSIFGSVSTTYVSQVAFGSSISGNALPEFSESVTINDSGSLRPLSVVDGGVIDGNLSVTGTTLDDSFTLQQVTTPAMQSPGGGFVAGSLNVNLGQAQSFGDRIFLGPNTEVDGSATLTEGNDTASATSGAFGDLFVIQGSVMQNVNVNMGNTLNSLVFTNNSVVGSPAPFVGGNMNISGGNGVNVIGQLNYGSALPFTTSGTVGEFTGTIDGNLSITLGSGNNGVGNVFDPTTPADPIILAPTLNGTLYWTSGNGQDIVQLGDSTRGAVSGFDYNFNVHMTFGNKDDTVVLDIGAAGTITGYINGGGRVAGNTFFVASGNEGSPFVVSNFP